MNKLSVIIIVKNPREIFKKTLDSVKSFDEVIIVNTGEEKKLSPFIQNRSNIKVFSKTFIGFGPLKQFAESQTSHVWILSLDSDEVLSEDAVATLLSIPLDQNSLYSFPFHNYLYGKWIKGCDWYPDRHIRLYHKEQTGFSSDLLHEKILTKNLKTVRLKDPINHYSYRDVEDFLEKMQRYSTLFAEDKKASSALFLIKAVLSSIFTFIKSYFFQRGIFLGAEGFIISMYKSQLAYYKYLKCWERFRS